LIEEIQSDAFKPDGGAEDVSVPFKKDSGYTNLALARAMRIAVDDGLDGIAVTDGVFQAKRNKAAGDSVVDSATSRRIVDPEDDDFGSYNDPEIEYFDYLAEQAGYGDEISPALPDPSYHIVTLETYEGGFDVSVDSETGTIFYSEARELTGKKLSDVLGSKDMANQLLAAGSEPVYLKFSERIVNDSGYKAVYDKRIPKRLNTIIKTMDLKDSPNVTKSDISVKAEKPMGSVSEVNDAINNSDIMDFGVYDPYSPLMKTFNQLKRFESDLDGDDIKQFDVTAGSAFYERVVETARFFDEIVNDMIGGRFIEAELLEEINDQFPSSGIQSTDELADLDLDDLIDITARDLRSKKGGKVEAAVYDLAINTGFMDSADVEDATMAWLSNANKNLNVTLEFMAESVGKNPINVPNNNTVIFTPEMREQIMAKGLPRLRKGGLVGKRA
jgi:hypothetical protein